MNEFGKKMKTLYDFDRTIHMCSKFNILVNIDQKIGLL